MYSKQRDTACPESPAGFANCSQTRDLARLLDVPDRRDARDKARLSRATGSWPGLPERAL